MDLLERRLAQYRLLKKVCETLSIIEAVKMPSNGVAIDWIAFDTALVVNYRRAFSKHASRIMDMEAGLSFGRSDAAFDDFARDVNNDIKSVEDILDNHLSVLEPSHPNCDTGASGKFLNRAIALLESIDYEALLLLFRKKAGALFDPSASTRAVKWTTAARMRSEDIREKRDHKQHYDAFSLCLENLETLVALLHGCVPDVREGRQVA